MREVTIINGRSEIELAKIKSESIDLVVTSPPYDNLRKYGGEGWSEKTFKKIAKEIKRVLKKGGVIVWVVGDQTVNGSETGTSFRQALYFNKIGLRIHDTMLYKKANPVPLTHRRYEQAFEYMFVLSKGTPKTFNPIMIDCKTAGQKNQSRTFYHNPEQNEPTPANLNERTKRQKQATNIWTYATGGIAKGHPAQFPKMLAKDQIKSWSNKGDVVLDPFMGAGTTAVAAMELDRNCIGVEVNCDYFDIMKEVVGKTNNNMSEKYNITEIREE